MLTKRDEIDRYINIVWILNKLDVADDETWDEFFDFSHMFLMRLMGYRCE